MAGGSSTTGGHAESGGAPRSRGDQHERPTSALVLVCCLGASILVGVLAGAGALGGNAFHEVQVSLNVLGGVLFFGAGLLQLAQWRLDGTANRGHTGLALLALGFLTPRITTLGPMLHDDPTAAVLSPWTAATVTALALALGATGPGRLDRWVHHSRAVAAASAAFILVLLYLPLVLGRGLPFTLDVPRWTHLLVALAMVALLFWVARRLRNQPAGALPATSLETAVVTAMGVVWLLRAAAVIALQPWALAATVLMTLVAVMALVESSTAFAAVFDAREQRAAEVEASLAAALRVLDEVDGEQRTVRHDARNSLFALNAAAQVLADHGPGLDDATRGRLRDAVRGELVALEQLLNAQAAGSGFPRQRRFGSVPREESA